MTSATIKVTGLNTPEVSNKLLWMFQDAYKKHLHLVNAKKGMYHNAWKYRRAKTHRNSKG